MIMYILMLCVTLIIGFFCFVRVTGRALDISETPNSDKISKETVDHIKNAEELAVKHFIADTVIENKLNEILKEIEIIKTKLTEDKIEDVSEPVEQPL